LPSNARIPAPNMERLSPTDTITEQRGTTILASAVMHTLTPTILSANPKEMPGPTYQVLSGVELGAGIYAVTGGNPLYAVAVAGLSRCAAIGLESTHRWGSRWQKAIPRNERTIRKEETAINRVYLAVSRAVLPTPLSANKPKNNTLAFIQATAAAGELIAMHGAYTGNMGAGEAALLYGTSRLLSLTCEMMDRVFFNKR
jgi:hypothetical protein